MFVWCIVVILVQPSYSAVYCDQAFECANTSTSIIGILYNQGYKSHYGSLASMSTNKWIHCQGALSCAKASLISNPYISCDATNSCSQLSILDTTGALANAYGVNAMIYSMISESQRTINCYGEQSCAYSVIKGANSIYGYGAYSLLNASIDSSINSTGSLTVNLYGYYSGFGANIICRTGDMCTIRCASNGCIGLHLECNNNCIVENQSKDTLLNDITDIWLYDSFIIATQNDAECSTDIDAITFDEKNSVVADIIVNGTIGGAICCRGYRGCYIYNYGKNIEYTPSTTEDAIICSGYESCRRSTIYSNGPVFCGGYYSCLEINIDTTGSVYCYGAYSCTSTIRQSYITGASHIYCSASHSCADCSISSNNRELNLYLLGYSSGSLASVSCNTSDHCAIYCYGYKSCYNLDLVCTGNCTVYCDEDSSCPNGWTAPSQSPIATSGPSQLPTTMPSNTVDKSSGEAAVDPLHTTDKTMNSQSDEYPNGTKGDGDDLVVIISIGVLSVCVILLMIGGICIYIKTKRVYKSKSNATRQDQTDTDRNIIKAKSVSNIHIDASPDSKAKVNTDNVLMKQYVGESDNYMNEFDDLDTEQNIVPGAVRKETEDSSTIGSLYEPGEADVTQAVTPN